MNITDSINDKEMITKMVGKLVFEYYDDNGIEVMKKSWDSVDIMKKLLIITVLNLSFIHVQIQMK